MQLIRPHQILGLLGDFPVFRRQKLRAYRRVEHVQQHLRKRLFPAGVGKIAHEMANQRLGDGSVYPVHGHVIPIVRGPAQRQLGHVPGSDHHAAALVGGIHQNLGPLPGL